MNETDRELLNLAAKAVELVYHATCKDGTKCIHDGRGYWNPIADDGDAFRLAVKLNLRVHFCPVLNRAIVREHFLSPRVWIEYGKDHSDTLAATRRAIVRAAAYIGSNMI